MLNKIRLILLIPALLTLMLLSACGTVDEPMTPYTQLSLVSPPDTPYEEKLVPNDPSHQLWRPGHWDYNGMEFTWVPGEMLTRPTLSAVWSADRWDKRTFGWAFVPGHWE